MTRGNSSHYGQGGGGRKAFPSLCGMSPLFFGLQSILHAVNDSFGHFRTFTLFLLERKSH